MDDILKVVFYPLVKVDDEKEERDTPNFASERDLNADLQTKLKEKLFARTFKSFGNQIKFADTNTTQLRHYE